MVDSPTTTSPALTPQSSPPCALPGKEQQQLPPLLLRSVLPPLALSATLTILCHAAAGPTLGLFLGGIAIMTLIAPALILSEQTGKNRILAAGALLAGIAAVWLAPVFQGSISFWHWLGACAVLAAYGAAIISLAIALHRWHFPAPAASAIALLAGLIWLTWPIWMAPWLTMGFRQQLVASLVAGHPLFTLNGLLLNEFPVPWSQYKLAYILTNIGDDIPYELPTNIARCLLGHSAVAAVLLLSCWRRPARISPAR